MQADATLVASDGKKYTAHGVILQLFFPVFKGMKLKKNQVIILDNTSSAEVALILGLAYGKGRWDFQNKTLVGYRQDFDIGYRQDCWQHFDLILIS